MSIRRFLTVIFFSVLQCTLGATVCHAQTDAAPLAQGSMAGSEESLLLVRPRWAVGAQVGLASGIGIGVRYHSDSRFSLQGVVGGFKVGDTQAASLGMEVQFDFDVMPASRFYGICGGSYNSYKTNPPEQLLKDRLRFGAGAGYEFSMSEKLVFTGSLIITYYTKSNDLFPIPQIGMFYNFR
jgi:hypothetical protein